MGAFSEAKVFGMTVRESLDDGSDFANPDADYRVLFLGEDGTLHTKDSSGTVSSPFGGVGDVATDTIWNAKGDLAVATAADTAQALTAGANGTILMAASGETTGLKWHALTTVDDIAGSDVTIVNATTDYDGPSESLAAGTYLFWCQIQVKVIVTTSQNYWWFAKLWDGSTIYGTSWHQLPIAQNYNNTAQTFPLVAIVTLGTTTTVKISVQSNRGSSASSISRNDPLSGSTDNRGTRMVAVKIA